MTSPLPEKPIEIIHADSLPDADLEQVAKALTTLVERSAKNDNVQENIHASEYNLKELSWIHLLIPDLEKLAVKYHFGNYVVVRGTDEQFFESMPLYTRLGMHLLFYGKEKIKLLGNKRIVQILREQSIKQGIIYDNPKSAKAIPYFIETYSISTDELLEPDTSKYKTFNEFFYRKLKPGARPVQYEADKTVISSAADCRLTVYQTVDLAKEFWVKGKNFNIPNLLNLGSSDPQLQPFQDGSIAIFRLAPADYHRFHSPVDGEVGDIIRVPGQYYTVNPQAVNQPGFDVFTANTRSILYMTETSTGLPVAFVAIGALLVGSIKWTGGQEKGRKVTRGEELGYFAYGGSTIVVIFPKGFITFDQDLVKNSKKPIETLVKVGFSIGKLPSGGLRGLWKRFKGYIPWASQ